MEQLNKTFTCVINDQVFCATPQVCQQQGGQPLNYPCDKKSIQCDLDPNGKICTDRESCESNYGGMDNGKSCPMLN